MNQRMDRVACWCQSLPILNAGLGVLKRLFLRPPTHQRARHTPQPSLSGPSVFKCLDSWPRVVSLSGCALSQERRSALSVSVSDPLMAQSFFSYQPWVRKIASSPAVPCSRSRIAWTNCTVQVRGTPSGVLNLLPRGY